MFAVHRSLLISAVLLGGGIISASSDAQVYYPRSPFDTCNTCQPVVVDPCATCLETTLVPWEEDAGYPSATGRFLVSDGWHYLRFLGFGSLGEYHEYWSRADADAGFSRVAELTVERRQAIVAPTTLA